jgi:hypothetical protein
LPGNSRHARTPGHQPARDEAEKLIQPAIWDVTVQALGDGNWQPSMNWLDVIELLGE